MRKTYGDLVHDVNTIKFVSNICTEGDHYKLLTTLVASLCSDQDISLSQHSAACDLSTGTALAPVQANLQLSDLWNRIANSVSKVGVFTSGTTGRAKLVEHRMETLVRSIRNTPRHREDVWGLTYHPASFAGLQVVLQAVSNLNPLVCLTGLDAASVHDEIRSQRISHLSATPTWLRLICSDGIVHKSVSHVTVGGEIADKSLIDQVQSRFPNALFRNIYASTESGSVLLSHGDVFRVPESLTGKFKVVDGMLAIHRNLLAESVQSQDPSEFYLTGDCVDVVLDNPLCFRFLARRIDWINVGGNKVNPHEIERRLVAIDGITDAKVFGRKNSVTGNIVCCEIVRSGSATITKANIRESLEKLLDSYMVPRIIEFVDAIDKTPTGKKDRLT